MSQRLGIFVSHPIQYKVPIWRELARMPELEVKVHFLSDHGVVGGRDPGFGVEVTWDVPLLEGYEHEMLDTGAVVGRPLSFRLRDARGLVERGHFDWVLVEGYQFPFELQILRAARRSACKVMMRGEFTDLKGEHPALWKRLIRKPLLRQLYKRVDAFAFVGEEARAHLLSTGRPEQALFFSPYSVDRSEFERQQGEFDRKESRAELGIDDDVFVFLFSGKLIPRKEIVRLVEAFELLEGRERAALLVLGDGEQREQVCQKGREILGDRFLFQGFVNQSQLGKYFLAADAHVLPSNYEAWGLVVNEAMQFGLPQLLSHMIGSARDLLKEGETGYLFRAEDTADLARAMGRMLSDPAHARAMGRNARELIKGYSTAASAKGIRDGLLSGA